MGWVSDGLLQPLFRRIENGFSFPEIGDDQIHQDHTYHHTNANFVFLIQKSASKEIQIRDYWLPGASDEFSTMV